MIYFRNEIKSVEVPVFALQFGAKTGFIFKCCLHLFKRLAQGGFLFFGEDKYIKIMVMDMYNNGFLALILQQLGTNLSYFVSYFICQVCYNIT